MRNSDKQAEECLDLSQIITAGERKKNKFYNPLLNTLIFLVFWLPHQVTTALKLNYWKSAVKNMKSALRFQGEERCQQVKQTTTANESYSSSAVPLSHYLQLLPTREKPEEPCRPLVIFYTWLMAKPRHVRKYLDMFARLQLDVLKVRISPIDVLQPTSRSQVAAKEVLEFVKRNPQYNRILAYGCSVGAYAFGEVCVMMEERPDEYSSVRKRFVGQVYDSPVDIAHMPYGVAASLAGAPRKQALIVSYVKWFFSARYEEATRHYLKSSSHIRAGAVRCPCLCLYSLEDDLSPARVNEAILQGLRQTGLQASSVVFDSSPHCAMLGFHPAKYEDAITKFFTSVGIINNGPELNVRSVAIEAKLLDENANVRKVGGAENGVSSSQVSAS